MTFPLDIPLGPWRLHPHLVFESLAYLVGFRWYLWQRRRVGDHLTASRRWAVVAAAIVGAALGSKLLFWLSDPGATIARWPDWPAVMGGKSMVGGLLGGWVAVEAAKCRLGIVRPTGDLFALPLVAGIAIGRIGCFLSGLGDHTHGLATALPWGVDFGDGLARHPTQLYEILWLLALGGRLSRMGRRPHREGDLFKALLIGYAAFRLLVEGLKPGMPWLGLTAIQWACVAILVACRRDLPRLLRRHEGPAHG